MVSTGGSVEGRKEEKEDVGLQQWQERNKEASDVDFQKELEVGIPPLFERSLTPSLPPSLPPSLSPSLPPSLPPSPLLLLHPGGNAPKHFRSRASD